MSRSSNASATRTKPVSFAQDRGLKRLVEGCLKVGKYQPAELFRWLVDDVLGDFGVRPSVPPPADTLAWLREHAALYGDLVARFPFEDLLGHVYQALGSRGHRGALGQFFTPGSISRLIAGVLSVPDQPADARLLRACEPACGAGSMLLAFMEARLRAQGPTALRHWSITAIDLDPICARMCSAQLLANLCVQQAEVGELVVYQGNALGPRSGLSVVFHATLADLAPDLVLPALHSSRLSALRDAVASRGPVHDLLLDCAAHVGTKLHAEPAVAHGDVSDSCIDLFADLRA